MSDSEATLYLKYRRFLDKLEMEKEETMPKNKAVLQQTQKIAQRVRKRNRMNK